ncbi:MAG: hypothetical protein LBU58_10665 [Clostridiales bacterium]|jgi:Fe-S-cluster containining protein|nr:hypothetical protein [Clostridiales bacterium]
MSETERLGALIARAYQIIGRETPLPADCGKLCGAACCRDGGDQTGTPDFGGGASGMDSDASGSDGDAPDFGGDNGSNETPGGGEPSGDDEAAPDALGMLLFPGEADALFGVEGFHISRIRYLDSRVWFLVCEGTCERRLRPLACRIFPLAPHVGGDGAVSALPDPRARRMCPLADGEFLQPRFRRAVGKALRALAQEPKMLEFMRLISAELDELRRFM